MRSDSWDSGISDGDPRSSPADISCQSLLSAVEREGPFVAGIERSDHRTLCEGSGLGTVYWSIGREIGRGSGRAASKEVPYIWDCHGRVVKCLKPGVADLKPGCSNLCPLLTPSTLGLFGGQWRLKGDFFQLADIEHAQRHFLSGGEWCEALPGDDDGSEVSFRGEVDTLVDAVKVATDSAVDHATYIDVD